MSTSSEKMSEVRDILKKLDRSIDAARAKRLEGDPEIEEADREDGSPENADQPAPNREGRARPKRATPMNNGGGPDMQRRVG